MVISSEQAEELARDTIHTLAKSNDEALSLLVDETVKTEKGWVFFYNSTEYVRSRDPLDALAGNGPIFVGLDGQVRELPSALPWEQALQSF